MSSTSPWIRSAWMVTIAALAGAACGADPASETGLEPTVLSCESDGDEIVERLRSGLPTYDYDPAVDLAALVDTSDVVLSGTIETIGRSSGLPDPDLGEDIWTVLTVGSPRVLHTTTGITTPPQEFSYASAWPTGAGPDPLAADIGVAGMAFVAFLHAWEPAPGGYTVAVQGLVVSCADDAPTAVIEPLPSDAAGVPLPELGSLVEATDEEAQPDTSAGLTVERGSPLGEPQTAPAPGAVKLWVSNQSFVDDPIHVTVTIGDATVVDEPFEVKGQHNWIAFDITGLDPGTHTIVAESETGASHTAEVTVRADEPRWLVLDYWYAPDDPGGRHFTFGEFDHAVAFA